MPGLIRWISAHFVMAEGVAVGMVISGVVFALRSRDSAFVGWIAAAAGVGLAVWALKLNGLW